MVKKFLNRLAFFKQNTLFDVLFYISFFASVAVGISSNKRDLIYVVPFVFISILLKYISFVKEKVNLFFVFSIFFGLISNVLSFYNFIDYYFWIVLATSVYLILFTLIIKSYSNKVNLKSIRSISVLLGIFIFSYTIFAVLELIFDFIPKNMLFITLLCVLCLIIYTLTFAMIYIKDKYNNAIILLTSGIFTFFQVCLSSINELFLYNKTFTVLIVICNVMSFYLFMVFISENKVTDNRIKYF